MAIFTAEYTFPADLNYQVYVKARQVKRNGAARTWASATSTSADFWVDATAPEFIISGLYTSSTDAVNVINEYGFATQEHVYAAFSATDSGSGIVSADYQINTSPIVDWTTATSTDRIDVDFTGSAAGSKHIYFTVIDNSGLFTQQERTFMYDMDYPADQDAPTVSVSGRTITCTIPNYSQTANYLQTEFLIASASGTYAEVISLSDKMTYTFSTDLTYQVTVKARQKKLSGRVRGWGSCSNSSSAVWIDTTAPVLSVADITSINGAGYCKTNPISVTTTVTDAHSGVGSASISVDGGAYAAINIGSASSINLGSDSLKKQIKIRATDNNGNTSFWEREFVLDTNAPTGLESADITSKFARNITWSVDLSSATDATSGLAGYEVRTADSDWGSVGYLYRGQEASFIQTASASTNLTLFFALYDFAGNYSTAVSSTAVHYPPALVSSASISYLPEINAISVEWDAVVLDSQGSSTDAVTGYLYFVAYRDAANVYQYNSATQYKTSTNNAYIPIPLAKLLVDGENAIKIYIKAVDNWLASSTAWAESGILVTRRLESADLSNNAFLFVVKKADDDGTLTVSTTTNESETTDAALSLLVDGNFENGV